MTRDMPTLAEAKAMAKALRARLAAEGETLGHSQALERIAQGHGFQSWNALYAAIEAHRPEAWITGDRVTGRYLGQPFTASVRSVERLKPGWVRLVLDLDEAVDVVRFDSFSNYRKQVRAEVGPQGHSQARTSDGTPHVVLDL